MATDEQLRALVKEACDRAVSSVDTGVFARRHAETSKLQDLVMCRDALAHHMPDHGVDFLDDAIAAQKKAIHDVDESIEKCTRAIRRHKDTLTGLVLTIQSALNELRKRHADMEMCLTGAPAEPEPQAADLGGVQSIETPTTEWEDKPKRTGDLRPPMEASTTSDKDYKDWMPGYRAITVDSQDCKDARPFPVPIDESTSGIVAYDGHVLCGWKSAAVAS